ncbi:MAG: hypothetical protein IPN07_04230 [Dehalococcoidia bacterium]|nr:hypothetical protein [Dehalococcoidia bacterium]
MSFVLGTVVECDQTGCTVRLVESGETTRAVFSQLVRDKVRIRRQQLVAIDEGSGLPEIAWRWFRGVVESIDDAGVAIRRLDRPPGSCRTVANPHGIAAAVGGEVYYGHLDDWEVVAAVHDDAPEDSESVCRRYFDRVREITGT